MSCSEVSPGSRVRYRRGDSGLEEVVTTWPRHAPAAGARVVIHNGGFGGREVGRPPAFWFALPADLSTSRLIFYARARVGGSFTSRRAEVTPTATR